MRSLEEEISKLRVVKFRRENIYEKKMKKTFEVSSLNITIVSIKKFIWYYTNFNLYNLSSFAKKIFT